MRHMTELEIEFKDDGAAPETVSFRLHHRCFAAWEIERYAKDERAVDEVHRDSPISSDAE